MRMCGKVQHPEQSSAKTHRRPREVPPLAWTKLSPPYQTMLESVSCASCPSSHRGQARKWPESGSRASPRRSGTRLFSRSTLQWGPRQTSQQAWPPPCGAGAEQSSLSRRGGVRACHILRENVKESKRVAPPLEVSCSAPGKECTMPAGHFIL